MKEGVTPRPPAGPDRREKRPINLERINLMWGLWTGLYMLEPWEQMLFSACWAAAAHAPTGAESTRSLDCVLPTHAPRPRLPLPPAADGFLVVCLSTLVYYFMK